MNCYPVILYPRSDLAQEIDLTKRYPTRVGLTNQLFALVNGILKAKRYRRKYVVIDSFLADAMLGIPARVSQVIDLARTQENLHRIPGMEEIQLKDRSGLGTNLSKVFQRATFEISWYSRHPRDLFNSILLSIEYVDSLKKIAAGLKPAANCSLVHLRIEDDMVAHLSRHHHLNYNYVKDMLISRYQEAITRYIPVNSEIFLMGEVNFLGLDKQYRFHNFNHDKVQLGVVGREICAIIDYLIARELTGVFVGAHRLSTQSGSTFSYYIMISLKKRGQIVLIDQNVLTNPLEIL